MSLDFSVGDALDLAHIRVPCWNVDGSLLGYLWFEHGETKLAVCDAAAAAKTDQSAADEALLVGVDVSEFVWQPEHPEAVAFVSDDDVCLFDVEAQAGRVLASGGDHASLTWHPDGDALAYLRDETLWIHDPDEGNVQAIESNVADLFSGTPVQWSPDGRYLATMLATTSNALGLGVFDVETLDVAWTRRPTPEDELAVASFSWVGDDHFVYAEDTIDGTE